jgi:hypothetical protein
MSDLIKRSDVIAVLVKHNGNTATEALGALFGAMAGDKEAKGAAEAFTVSLEHATLIKNEINDLPAVTV